MKIKIGASHIVLKALIALWSAVVRWRGIGCAGSVGLCAGRERVLVYNAVLLFLPGRGGCCIIWLVFVVVRYILL